MRLLMTFATVTSGADGAGGGALPQPPMVISPNMERSIVVRFSGAFIVFRAPNSCIDGERSLYHPRQRRKQVRAALSCSNRPSGRLTNGQVGVNEYSDFTPRCGEVGDREPTAGVRPCHSG